MKTSDGPSDELIAPRIEIPNELLAMELSELDPVTSQSLAVKQGVLVARVLADPARGAGFESGDVITLFNGKSVQSLSQLVALIKATPKARTVAVLVKREGAARFIALKLN